MDTLVSVFVYIFYYAAAVMNLLFLVQEIGDENDDNENQSEAEDEATRLHPDDGHDDDKEAPIVIKVVLHDSGVTLPLGAPGEKYEKAPILSHI